MNVISFNDIFSNFTLIRANNVISTILCYVINHNISHVLTVVVGLTPIWSIEIKDTSLKEVAFILKDWNY